MEKKRWIIKDLSSNGWFKKTIGFILFIDKDREKAHRFKSKKGAESFRRKIIKCLGEKYEVEQF